MAAYPGILGATPWPSGAIWDRSVHPGRAADAHVCFMPTLVIRATAGVQRMARGN